LGGLPSLPPSYLIEAAYEAVKEEMDEIFPLIEERK
jgi:hypothetical protein